MFNISGKSITGSIKYKISSNSSDVISSILGNVEERKKDNTISNSVEGILVDVSTILDNKINTSRMVNNKSIF
jgi:hypothetical protein